MDVSAIDRKTLEEKLGVKIPLEPWSHQKEGLLRAHNEPNFAFFFDPGCVAWHTKIKINRGGCSREYTIEEAYRLFNNVELSPKQRGWNKRFKTRIRSLVGDWFGLNEVVKIVRSGEKELYRVYTDRYGYCEMTADHEVFTKRGWVRCQDLLVGEDMVAMDVLTKHKKKSRAIAWRTVRKVVPAGTGMTYDIVCKDPHRNFVANGMLVHNCGKSAVSITSSRAKMARQGRAMKVLVITPLLTLRNWMMEWRKYSNIDHAKIIPLTGTGAKRAKTVQDNPKAQVFIASYETTLMADVVRSLLEWGPEILIVDESQKVKSHTAKRSKAVRMISGYVRYRYLLSGTPILKDPMDLFSQFLILDQGLTFGTNFFEFQRKYFYDKNERMPSLKHFPKWVLKKNAEDAIKERISRISMSAKKSEVLDLPPYLVKSIPLAMTGEQEKAYKEMAKDLVTYLDGKSCTAPMALTKSLRLMQIVSGFISLEDIDGTKSERRFEKHTKKLALYELLEDLAPNHKVLVWAVWKQNYIDIRQVFAALGLKHVELTGETNAAEKFRGMDQFNNDPDIRVALCHPGAGGVGVNLVAASYNVYYSRTFSLEEYLQSQARCYRGGSEIHESVTEINLTIENSIDEIVMDALTNKSDMSNRIIGELSAKLRSQL